MLSTPDENAAGLRAGELDPLRYDGHSDNPHEVAGMMRREVPSNAKVLDVGCGTGSLALVVNRGKGNEVLGLEPDPVRAAAASERGLTVVNSELTPEFLAEHGSFDAIIFADVLEHVPTPKKIIDLAMSGLKSGGLMLISVPNVAHWSVRANLLVGRFNYEEVGIMDATHLRWFTRKTIRQLVENSGLEVLSIRASAGASLPVYYRSIFRILPRRLLERAVYTGASLFPTLFGGQHVVVARKP